jgi:triacylglycerol lipase
MAGLGFLVDALVDPLCAPCQQFLVGSDFVAKLTEGGVAMPGVHYTTIVTRYDQAVMPAENGLLPAAPNVTPILLQDSCVLDFSDHVNLAADPNVAGHILHALDPAGAPAPSCQLFLPYL